MRFQIYLMLSPPSISSAGRRKNRGDNTAIELFLAGMRTWESWIQLRLNNPKSSIG